MKSIHCTIIQTFRDRIRLITDILLALILSVLLLIGITVLRYPVLRGLTGNYYAQPDWTGAPIMTDLDQELSLRKMRRKFPDMIRMYSIHWTGVIFIATPGLYQFSTMSDDGSELSIDGQLVVDNRGVHGLQERSGTIALEQGFHDIHIRYMQSGGGAAFRSYWTPLGQQRESLSKAPLFPQVPSKNAFRMDRLITLLGTGLKFLNAVGIISFVLLGAYAGYARLPDLSRSSLLSLIFFVVFLSHFSWSPITTSFDSKWAIHTTMSLIREGDTDLDEYEQVVERYRDHTIEGIDGHLYTIYPVGTSLLAVPVVFVVDRFLDRVLGIDFEQTLNAEYMIPKGLERCTASLFVACSALLVYLIGAHVSGNRRDALCVTFIFSFCTSAWSSASRALWQHGPSMLLLALALYLLLVAQRFPRCAPWCIRGVSLPLAFSFIVRPTNSISIALLTMFIVFRYRKFFFSYCLWSLLVVIPFILLNFHVYHAVFPPYYLPHRQLSGGGDSHYIEALLGTLVSPSRGLFIFSPILLFSLYGIVLKIRQKQMESLDYALIGSILLHWLVSAAHLHWWGGYSYGPRYFTDMLPYLIYFLIPVFSYIPNFSGKRKAAFRSLLVCCVLISFFIHYRGAHSQQVYDWNASPVSVDLDPSRVWNLRDVQFLRGL